MLDFEVQCCSRRCCKTDREFKPGDCFYSVLVAEGADVVRYDYCADAWEGAPDTAVGWWRSQMPQSSAKTTHWAPHDVVLHYFEQLENRPDKEDVRYVLALLMLRRRIVRLEQTETDASGREVMVLYCPRNESQYRTAVETPRDERVREIQEELAQLLLADAT
jgi:hypothetical protein